MYYVHARYLVYLISKILHEGQIQKLEQEEHLEKEEKMKEASNEKVEKEKNETEEKVDSQKEPLKTSDEEKMGLSWKSPSNQVGCKSKSN